MTQDIDVLSNEPASFDPNTNAATERQLPRVWTVWVTLLFALMMVFAAQITVVLALFAYFMSNGKVLKEIQPLVISTMMTPPMFILMLFLGPGLFGLGALVAARLSPETLRKRLGFVPIKISPAIYPLSIIGSLFPTVVGIGMAEALVWLVPRIPVDHSSDELYRQMTPLWSIPFVILIGLVPGVCEEMLFRGYIQRRFISRWRPFWGITLSSVLFGLAHVMPAAILMATVIGFYLGVVAWKCGSIWPSIGCHIFINSSVNFWRMIVIFFEIPERTQSILIWIGIVVSAACFAASLRLLWRQQNERSLNHLAS